MAEKKSRKRIEIIDIAKCIAIFMVVLGHTSPNKELVENTPMLTKILYSTHMPLFFFLSGLSIPLKSLETRHEWRLFLRKTLLTICVPFLIWGLVYCNFSFQNVALILYGSWAALGKAQTLTSLWYLSCLFCARILVQIIISLFSHTEFANRRMLYLIPAAVCMVVGVLFPNLENGYPWCLNIAFTAAGCMLVGIAARYGVIRLSVQKGQILCLLLAASVLLYAVAVILLGDRFINMMMCRGYYGNPLIALVLAVLGSFAVMLLSMLLKRMVDEWFPALNLKAMIYLGQHTMGVFLLHKPLLQDILMPAFRSLLPNGPDILVRLPATLIALVVSTCLCRLIEYYIPELVGIFSGDVIKGREGWHLSLEQ